MGFIERCCPTCGSPMASRAIEVDLASGMVRCGVWQMWGLPRRQSLLLDGLARAYPRGISKSMAIEVIYGEHEDHLKNPENAVEFTTSGLRRSLKQAGAPFTVKSKRFGGYWIEIRQQ